MLTTHAAHKKDLRRKSAVFTHQHFRVIAETIRNMPTHAATLRTARESCARTFADSLAATNPHFNRERFLSACLTEVAL